MMDENLSESWKLWRECLLGDDSNTIFSQISNMVWDSAIFRLFLESRQNQIREHKGLPGLNVRLHRFIDWNFFVAQTTSIRRLLDRHGLHGNKGVYSLRALLKDISNRRENLTRKAFLDLLGLPYEYSRESNYPDEFVWFDIGDTHQRFDRLSGKTPTNRTPIDLISDKVFDKLRNMLDSCNPIVKYVDKYIAHSATPESRIVDNANEIKITLDHIWVTHQTIFQVAAFLSGSLFSQDFSPLPWESPDMFETANIPVVETNRVSDFEKVWKKYRDGTELWRLNESEKLWKVIENETKSDER